MSTTLENQRPFYLDVANLQGNHNLHSNQSVISTLTKLELSHGYSSNNYQCPEANQYVEPREGEK